jgi:hypothetical protein
MKVQRHALLISAVHRCVRLASRSVPFAPEEKGSWCPLKRKPGEPQSRSGNSREEKNLFCPYKKSKPDDSVAQHYTDRGLPATGHNCTARITAEGSAGSQGTGVDWQHNIVAGNNL